MKKFRLLIQVWLSVQQMTENKRPCYSRMVECFDLRTVEFDSVLCGLRFLYGDESVVSFSLLP